jgi:Zn-dependent protease
LDYVSLVRNLLLAAVPILISITFHEIAHGYTAYKLGDPTAKMMGRLTINPIAHIDPVGTVLMPIMLFILSNGSFIFGSAKPVPVAFNNLRNPRRDSALVSAAGPAANIILSFVSILLFIMLVNVAPHLPLSVNDRRILTSLLPTKHAYQFSKLEPYGIFIVLALWFMGIARYIIIPIQAFIELIIRIFLIPFGGLM